MKTIIFVFLLAVLAAGGVLAEEMLFGVSYVLDTGGNIFPRDSDRLEQLGIPLLLMLSFSEDGETAAVHYTVGDDFRRENVQMRIYKTPERPYWKVSFPLGQFGTINLSAGDEVVADELGAGVAAYQVRRGDELYTAVGVLAAEKHQDSDEQRALFHEIIGEFEGETASQ